MQTIILGIESSCDDTSAGVWADGRILSNITASQAIHEKYGGVVPEVASRLHQAHIIPVVAEALSVAGVDKRQLSAVAFTRGPGLMGSLIVGVTFAKSLALSLNIPILEVNHLQAHVLSHFTEPPYPAFPFICLLVSGGHTQLVVVRSHTEMEIIGQTLDDAAGEAFDKTGKLLGLGYPAGPHIDRLAQTGKPVFPFPDPQIAGFDYSFSGLKTAFLYFLKEQQAKDPEFMEKNLPDICASVQHTIVRFLLKKLQKAVEATGIKNVAIAGGVSANSGLRSELEKLSRKKGWQIYTTRLEYCTDNGAMIAMAGYFKYVSKDFSSQTIAPLARWHF